MNKINLLSKETSNKIAAGEVVERPASAVKELIENSIDAGASNIVINIEDGGQQLILVKDDGSGIEKEDLALAFLPHATSKISSIEDIYAISSLGFRGEALPSIASVSDIKIQSRIKDSISGHELILEGGKVKTLKEIGCSLGTTIEVKNLFYNVPARQKFLKSTNRETAVISEMILKIALCNYNVSFTYFNNNKRVYATPGSGELLENVRILYGKEVSNNVYYFEGHSDIASVYGYIGNETISKGSRGRQTIYVNKRHIKNQLITVAVENAFKSFLTINKYPFFTLFLEIFPELIDVNVHPAKSEIKFKDDKLIYKLVFDSVHKALRENLQKSFSINDEDIKVPFVDNPTSNIHSYNNNKYIYSNNNNYDDKLIKQQTTSYSDIYIDKETGEITEATNNQNINSVKVLPMEIIEAKFPKIKIIGQYNSTYIIGEAFNELYLIDQHAAHEKIMFEKYNREISQHKIVTQIILVPILCDLTPDEYTLYEENISLFKDAGFIIEPFGDNTISIREYPMVLGDTNCKKIFYEILDNIKAMGSGNKIDVNYSKIATIACKAAVKANNSLSFAEMEYLIEELRYIDDPFRCPHGRPTIIKFALTDIEKMFKRIQ